MDKLGTLTMDLFHLLLLRWPSSTKRLPLYVKHQIDSAGLLSSMPLLLSLNKDRLQQLRLQERKAMILVFLQGILQDMQVVELLDRLQDTKMDTQQVKRKEMQLAMELGSMQEKLLVLLKDTVLDSMMERVKEEPMAMMKERLLDLLKEDNKEKLMDMLKD